MVMFHSYVGLLEAIFSGVTKKTGPSTIPGQATRPVRRKASRKVVSPRAQVLGDMDVPATNSA